MSIAARARLLLVHCYSATTTVRLLRYYSTRTTLLPLHQYSTALLQQGYGTAVRKYSYDRLNICNTSNTRLLLYRVLYSRTVSTAPLLQQYNTIPAVLLL
eukprot:1529524-Pyramimonas_sp.AAC.1